MERDSLIAHGTAYLLHDRLVRCSDATLLDMCTSCGSLLSVLNIRVALGNEIARRQPNCRFSNHENTRVQETSYYFGRVVFFVSIGTGVVPLVCMLQDTYIIR